MAKIFRSQKKVDEDLSIAEANKYDKTEADTKFVDPTDYATPTVGGTIKTKLVGTILYTTDNGIDP